MDSQKLVETYNVHSASVMKASFSKDDRFILSCSNDQKACITPVSVDMILNKIEQEKVRGIIYQLSDEDKAVFGIE
jgi:hypothetical protein